MRLQFASVAERNQKIKSLLSEPNTWRNALLRPSPTLAWKSVYMTCNQVRRLHKLEIALPWNSSGGQILDHANRLRPAMERIMKTAATSCTECGAAMKPDQVLCSRCSRPRWHTLKRVSACFLIVAVFAVLIRFAVMYGDRTLNLWFG